MNIYHIFFIRCYYFDLYTYLKHTFLCKLKYYNVCIEKQQQNIVLRVILLKIIKFFDINI